MDNKDIIIPNSLNEDHVRFISKTKDNQAKKVTFYIGIQFKQRELCSQISPNAMMVLVYLTSRMYLNNVTRVNIQETYNEIHMNRKACFKAFSELVEKKLIVNFFRRNYPMWLINPAVSFKGTFKNQQALIKRFNKLIQDDKNS